MNIFETYLMPYQIEAINSMKNGNILVGGVGSGKSITSLGYYLKNEQPKELYIITTARKRDTHEWEEELNKCSLQAKSIDSWNNIKKYKDVKDSFFIFDEQRVVGYGVWTKIFLEITKKNDWILLSATPADTWSDLIPVFIANGFYKNKTDFCNQHVIWARYSKYPQIKGYWNQGLLNQHRSDILVNMDYIRPTEIHHENINVMYDQILYKTIQKLRKNPFNENRPIKNVSEFCFVLRRIVNSDPSRIEMVETLLRLKKTAIIFYKYDFELELLRQELDREGMIFSEWNGHKHEAIPTGKQWAYLVQYTAGSDGWNCVTTDTMIFYSDDYSYKTMVQAAGRIDRLNTPFKDLYYFHLRSSAPIDRAIARSLSMKKNFNENKFVKI